MTYLGSLSGMGSKSNTFCRWAISSTASLLPSIAIASGPSVAIEIDPSFATVSSTDNKTSSVIPNPAIYSPSFGANSRSRPASSIPSSSLVNPWLFNTLKSALLIRLEISEIVILLVSSTPNRVSSSSMDSKGSGIYSPSFGMGLSCIGSTLKTLNPLLVSPGKQTHPPSVNVQPATLSASANFPANSFTTFIDALLSGSGTSPESSTVRYTRLNVDGLTPTFLQKAASVIDRKTALDMSISSAVIISIGSIIASYRKKIYPVKVDSIDKTGRHSTCNGLILSHQLQKRRRKKGVKVFEPRQRQTITDTTLRKSAMNTSKDTTTPTKNAIQSDVLDTKQTAGVGIFQQFNTQTQEFLLVVLEAVITGNQALYAACKRAAESIGQLADFEVVVKKMREVVA